MQRLCAAVPKCSGKGSWPTAFGDACRAPTPVYGGEDSPASLSGLAGAEHLQGGWDPTTMGQGRPLSWDAMAHVPSNVPAPVRAGLAPQRPARATAAPVVIVCVCAGTQ